jgi:hypothetical protein
MELYRRPELTKVVLSVVCQGFLTICHYVCCNLCLEVWSLNIMTCAELAKEEKTIIRKTLICRTAFRA